MSALTRCPPSSDPTRREQHRRYVDEQPSGPALDPAPVVPVTPSNSPRAREGALTTLAGLEGLDAAQIEALHAAADRPLDDFTRDQLRDLARDLEVPGWGHMRKPELVDAIRKARS